MKATLQVCPPRAQARTGTRKELCMATLSLEHIGKKYPNGYEGVKDFNLEIADKEFISSSARPAAASPPRCV